MHQFIGFEKTKYCVLIILEVTSVNYIYIFYSYLIIIFYKDFL